MNSDNDVSQKSGSTHRMKGDESGPFEPALRTSWLEVGAVVLIIAGLGLYDGIRRLRGWVYDEIAEQSVDTAGGQE